MKHDLTMLPGDWWLGVWWIELRGAYWMLLVRCLTREPESQSAGWLFEEGIRADQPGSTWDKGSCIHACGELTACMIADERRTAALARVSCVSEYGHRIFRGPAASVLRTVETPGRMLPAWMSVLLIEDHAPSALPVPPEPAR